MQRLNGIVVSEGLARGEVLVVGAVDPIVKERRISKADQKKEIARFEKALTATRRDINELKEQTRAVLGDASEIIQTYLAYLGDDSYLLDPIRELILVDRLDAAAAVARRFDAVADELRPLPEPLPSRIPDLQDIKRRMIGNLHGRKVTSSLERLPKRVILVADDLAPTMTATLDREKVLAIVTDRGGPASHTAILARHLGIPALVGLGSLMKIVETGDQILVDGLNGAVVLHPDEATVAEFESRKRRLTRGPRQGHSLASGVRTSDGEEIELVGNIDSGEGAKELRDLGVRGVGLFRTEYLYLGREDAPDESLQTQHYARLLRDMAPYPVCIRTMDFGADKWDHRVGAGHEPNPFLGMRAIRLSFAHENVFRAQLRAILRAASSGKAKIMFPMITDAAEFRRARAVVDDEISKLALTGVNVKSDIPVGAMVEVPAAALTSDALLEVADFISLGSNDLTQYTLAVDRTNPLVASLYLPHHPAVLRLIKIAADAARRSRKPISVCGEMAGSRRHFPILLGLGIRTLSMAASRVHDVVDQIRKLSIASCTKLAVDLLASSDADEAGRILDEFHGDSARRVTRRP